MVFNYSDMTQMSKCISIVIVKHTFVCNINSCSFRSLALLGIVRFYVLFIIYNTSCFLFDLSSRVSRLSKTIYFKMLLPGFMRKALPPPRYYLGIMTCEPSVSHCHCQPDMASVSPVVRSTRYGCTRRLGEVSHLTQRCQAKKGRQPIE